MTVYDQHLHTELSFDSREKMRNYLELAKERGISHFVSTEHVDLASGAARTDIVPDFKLQQEQIEYWQKIYPDVKLLMGVEIGYKPSQAKKAEAIINSFPFDIVMLSIHESEDFDAVSEDFKAGRSSDEVYAHYLRLTEEAVTAFKNYDTLGHIDYMLRYIEPVNLKSHVPALRRIFEILVNDGKALELNTRIFARTGSMKPAEFFTDLYIGCGGRKFTIGSDAHSAKSYMFGFDEHIKLLKNRGINEVCGFIARREVLITL